jgi:histidinol-phosphate/aromatic aminotransferase/cobyric acid decarboxylase-like protein/GNAT superfamily N-acetyltransferase
VYARELGQHAINSSEPLTDCLDDANIYLVVRGANDLAGSEPVVSPNLTCDRIAGFISITPPQHGQYSIEKYFDRSELPFAIDRQTFEIRLLTVLKPHRGGEIASLLMYGALRWVEAHGGTRIVAIGRREVADMYVRSGLRPTGATVQAGAVAYDLMEAKTEDVRERLKHFRGLLDRLESKSAWQLPFSFRKPASCFHGGAFFQAIGSDFQALERSTEIINADVLDAWFPPSPKVLSVLQEYLPWLLRTSPPTACEGLVQAIANSRGVGIENILPGAGSSDLIFRAFLHWLKPESHALILDPTYGEHAHVLEKVIGCTVDRLTLQKENSYAVDRGRLSATLLDGYDLVVIVNPNSPTGQFIPREELEQLLGGAPAQTRIWVDETYIEYAGREQSLERFAARAPNVVVCKSMSKVYALSGARAAYLCAAAHQLEDVRAITPPWVIGLPTQVAAVNALQDEAYYQRRYAETRLLREKLTAELQRLGMEVIPGVANFLLCHLPDQWPDAAEIVKRCRKRGLFIRDARLMGAQLGERTLRIAVKDAATNERMIRILVKAGSCG